MAAPTLSRWIAHVLAERALRAQPAGPPPASLTLIVAPCPRPGSDPTASQAPAGGYLVPGVLGDWLDNLSVQVKGAHD
jgi:hypothetical protein